MKAKLEWLTEEEGRITVSENETTILTAEVFVTGEEAEFRIQDVVFPEKTSKNDDRQEKIIPKVTKCVLVCFRLLWGEGLEEVVLVEPRGTKLAKILDSTTVVQNIYKEYMMRRRFEPQITTGCGQNALELVKEEDGFVCENAEHTFYCRLLPYAPEHSGENCFYLYEVEVKKNKRNKGIATACLTELFHLLSKETPAVFFLQVGSYNEPAVHLYEKLGFEVSEELRYYVPEE